MLGWSRRLHRAVGGCLLAGVFLAACSNVKVHVAPRVTATDLQKIKKVAVLFGSGSPTGSFPIPGLGVGSSAEAFGDALAVEMLGIGLDVVERQQLDKVTGEQALGLSGVTEGDKTVAIGKVLAVDAILTGTVDSGQEFSTGYVMGIGAGLRQGIKNATVKVLDVERGNLVVALSASYSSVKTVQEVAQDIAEAFKKKREGK